MADNITDDLGILIPRVIHHLLMEDNTVLSSDRLQTLLESANFMRTSTKNMSGVFTDQYGQILNMRLVGQVAAPLEIIGSLKFIQPSDISLTKVTNAKWKPEITLPGFLSLEPDLTSMLLNQALFFSSLQAKHEESFSETGDEETVWSFVKNRFETEFVLTANHHPMFYKYKSTEKQTMKSLKTAIENAKSGSSINNEQSIRFVDSLENFPDSDGRFKRIPADLKRQLLLNIDGEVYDVDNNRIHPYKYPEVFDKDVWCIMDVSMKLIHIPDGKTPSRTYQLVLNRLQALNVSKFKKTTAFMNRVAGVKRAAPDDFETCDRKPIPAVTRPFHLSNVSLTDRQREKKALSFNSFPSETSGSSSSANAGSSSQSDPVNIIDEHGLDGLNTGTPITSLPEELMDLHVQSSHEEEEPLEDSEMIDFPDPQ